MAKYRYNKHRTTGMNTPAWKAFTTTTGESLFSVTNDTFTANTAGTYSVSWTNSSGTGSETTIIREGESMPSFSSENFQGFSQIVSEGMRPDTMIMNPGVYNDLLNSVMVTNIGTE